MEYTVKPRMQTVSLGGQILRVEVLPLLGRNILIVGTPCTVPKGRKFYGKVLAENVVIQAGSILTSRWIAHGGRRVRTHQLHESIYRVLLSFEHAETSESRAREGVRISIETAVMIVRDLVVHGSVLTRQQRGRLKRFLATLRARFARARADALTEATRKIDAAAGLRDLTGRTNLGASAARITAAKARYQVRLAEITAIVPYLSRFRTAALEELARIWWLLDQDYALIKKVLRAIPRVREGWHIRWISANLRLIQEHVATIRAAPFYRNGQYLRAELTEALSILETASDAPKATAQKIERHARTMCDSIEFKRTQRELERLIYRLSRALESRSYTDTQKLRLQNAIALFCGRVLRLDESAFLRKRLSRVTRHLRCAEALLGIGALQDAKDSLKSASAFL